MVANGHFEMPSATVELQFNVGEILFEEHFTVYLISPLIRLLLLQ